MEFFKKQTTIKFMELRRITGIVSGLAVLIAVIMLCKQGLNFGLEFTGGTQVELHFEEPTEATVVKQQLEIFGLKDLRVQNYGSAKELLIRLANKTEDEAGLKTKILHALQNGGYTAEVRRVEYVGSEVGAQLAEDGGLAVVAAILFTMLYIALRFEYRFAVSAALSLTHDIVIVLGIFSLCRFEFDLATLAGVLAVLGYSLNDKIVVFDRVRENFRRVRKESTAQIINLSINQTLSRTIMTSFLTLLVVIALLLFGGGSLFGFSLALCLGIIIGTYSSIYVAGGLALSLGLSREDLLPKPKAAIDELP